MRLIPKNRITHIIIVRHLNLVEQNYIFKLRRIAHHGALADDRISPNERTMPDFRVLSDNGRPMDICGLKHLR